MKVVVTGGAGYIGSHTIIDIVESTNWEIVSIDSYINSTPDTYRRIKEVTGKEIEHYKVDLCDKNALKNVFNEIGAIAGVIHFAALKAVGDSVENPLLYYQNNITGLLNILECCANYNIPNLIFSSSCSIYGNVDVLPVDETTPLAKSESPYAATKAIGEEILKDFSKVSNTNLIALRYFNPVGAHSSGLIGENPINKPSNLFPVITQTAVGIIEEMQVFGADYKTRDGSCIRDYIHVSDIANAHILALKYAVEQGKLENLEFYNLGSGNGMSVLEAISTFEDLSNIKLNYKLSARRPGDVESIYSNSKKAKSQLGWETKFALTDMMSSAWNWQQQLEKEKNEQS